MPKAKKPRKTSTPREKTAVERLPERQKRLELEIIEWEATARKSSIKNWKENQIKRKEKTLSVQMEKMIAGAVIHIVPYQFERALDGKNQLKDIAAIIKETPIDLKDDYVTIIRSADGYDLFVHVPKMMADKTQETLAAQIKAFGASVNIGRSESGKHKGTEASYKDRDGCLAGIFKLVKIWHPIGHPNAEPTMAKDMARNMKTFSKATELIPELRFLSARLNTILKCVDPEHYDAAVRRRDKLHILFPFCKALDSLDNLIFEGREFLFNRETEDHLDGGDPKTGWAILCSFGEHTGGEFVVPGLNLECNFSPGTSIMVRGRVLRHHVKPFADGQRICIAHFTHEDLWRTAGFAEVPTTKHCTQSI